MNVVSRVDLVKAIKSWGMTFGFQQVGISDCDLSSYEAKYWKWIEQNYHGEMGFMVKHGHKRTRPQALIPQTRSIISVRMDYLPPETSLLTTLKDKTKAYISRYALGRDYHRLMRKKLKAFAEKIQTEIGKHGYRVFTDSAPVLEKPIAEKAGLGWIGKNTNIINAKAGSWFFLGEIYTDLLLPTDQAITKSHCGSCSACIDVCPTGAIVAPYVLDARKCISYLTIELKGSIPSEFRPLIGNRIYGCDDCQLICPWNKFAKTTAEKDFHPRHQLESSSLVDLFSWSENDFLKKTEGSSIRRIGYESWLRNIAVALGNADYSLITVNALREKLNSPYELVREHVHWALKRQAEKLNLQS